MRSSSCCRPFHTGWQPLQSKSNVLLMPVMRMPCDVGGLAPASILKSSSEACSALEGVSRAEIR